MDETCETDEREPCPGCGDGDRVPPTGHFHCPVCDAEWDEEDDAALTPVDVKEEA